MSLFNERTLYSIPNNTGYVKTVPMGNSYSVTTLTRAYLDKVDQSAYTKVSTKQNKGKIVRKVIGRVGISEPHEKTVPLYEFFRPLLEYFFGLFGIHNFFFI